MRYALLNNNIVENIIEADAEFVSQITGYELILEVDETVGIGFTYDGENFTAPSVVPIPEPELPDPPVADFYASQTTGIAPLLVNFYSTTTGADTYSWDFTNDGIEDADTANSSYLFETVGTYTVRFRASNAGGSTVVTKTDFITVEPPPALPNNITLLALNLRMTRTERDAVRAAQISDPDVSDVMFLMSQATYIDLDRSETIGGVQMLEAKGLLGVGRADEILTAPIQPVERPITRNA